MKQESARFLEKANIALGNEDLQARNQILGSVLSQARDAGMDQLGNFEEVRDHLKQVKNHALENLEHYLRCFEEQVQEQGGHVHWARDSDELNDIVLKICQRSEARHIGKGKSMITEETGLTEHLEKAGLEVTETDLGEYIVQSAKEPPSHIVGPAFHKSEQEIRELFFEQHDLGPRDLASPPEMVQEARTVLRKKFLQADVGIIGANALIAETGQTMLVTNEGNGDLVSTLPRVHIVCASIEKIVPRLEDATTQLRLLARSAIGTASSSYTSFYCGPRRAEDLDGPEEFHVVLLDNRRSEIIGTDFQEMLHCMRCGACLNHCPIYVNAGGHAYGWVYPGPMGSVLTPLLTGLESSNALPNACTACGRCAEVCPSGIPLPDLLRDLRAQEKEQGLSPWRFRWALKFHGWLAQRPRLYQFITSAGIAFMHRLGRTTGSFPTLPIKNGWTDVRDFPAPQGNTFMQRWKKQGRSKKHG